VACSLILFGLTIFPEISAVNAFLPAHPRVVITAKPHIYHFANVVFLWVAHHVIFRENVEHINPVTATSVPLR